MAVPGPDGNAGRVIKCKETAKCYEKAAVLCANGYVVEASSKIGRRVPFTTRYETELVVSCKLPESVGGLPPREDTAVCQAAFKEMPTFAAYWVAHAMSAKALDELPEQRDFVTTCQAMPENVQRCVHTGYRNVHAQACDAVLSRLNPLQRSRFDALFLEAPGTPGADGGAAPSGPSLAL